MKLVPVNELPKGRKKHDVRLILEEFEHSINMIAEVQFDDKYEYGSILSAYRSISNARRYAGMTNIRVHLRGDKIYLSKKES